MKIAYLAPEFYPPIGGVGIYSFNLVKELSKMKNMDIHVITPARGKDYNKDKVLRLFKNRIQIHNISNANDDFFYNFAFQYKVMKELPKLDKEYNFDVIHSANLVHMPDIFLKLKNYKKPTIVTCHTTIRGQVSGFLHSNKNFFKMAPSEKMSLLAYPYIRFLEKIYLKKTKYAISVSNKFAGELREKEGYKGKLEVIHNGIDLDLFNYKKTKNPYEKFPQLKDKNPIVLYAGRLITQKGIEIFVKLMKEMENDNVHFAIAGKGDEKNFFKLIDKYKVQKNKFTFIGFVNNIDLPWLYKACDIFILPSYYENFPISILEAMSMGCVCIASDVGAIDEIINNEKNGFIVKENNSKNFNEKIKKMMKNKELMKNIADQGRNKISRNFSSKIMTKKTKEFYDVISK